MGARHKNDSINFQKILNSKIRELFRFDPQGYWDGRYAMMTFYSDKESTSSIVFRMLIKGSRKDLRIEYLECHHSDSWSPPYHTVESVFSSYRESCVEIDRLLDSLYMMMVL